MIDKPGSCDLQDEAFAEIRRKGGILAPVAFAKLLMRAGRVNGPAMLLNAWYGHRITLDTLRANIGDVWSNAEYPQQSLSHRDWREMFDAAGYTVDGITAERPAEPIRLWRGAPLRCRRRWSWTDNLVLARCYAEDGLRGRLPGSVWETVSPPGALLYSNTGRTKASLWLTHADWQSSRVASGETAQLRRFGCGPSGRQFVRDQIV